MNQLQQSKPVAHILWIFPGKLADSLDSATWLQTTKHLRASGWQVTLVCVGPKEQQALNSVAVTSIPSIERFFLRSTVYHIRLLRYILTRWRTIDIVLIHQMSVLWVIALMAYRKLRGDSQPRFVMDTRDLNAVDDGWKSRIRKLYYDVAHGLANRWFDGQTAITERMAKLVQIPSSQLLGCWPSGVDVVHFAAAAEKRGWPQVDEPIHLIYIGILLVERNLRALCEAVKQANAEGMSFSLTFAGTGPDQPALAALAAVADGRIRLTPPVAHDKVPDLLRQAHIGVTSLPEPGNEKFQASSPIKLYEYMAAGLPVLATRIVCHTDVVGEGRYAFWAEDATVDGLIAALRNIWRARAQLAMLGNEASRAVEQSSWQAATQRLSHALERSLISTTTALADPVLSESSKLSNQNRV